MRTGTAARPRAPRRDEPEGRSARSALVPTVLVGLGGFFVGLLVTLGLSGGTSPQATTQAGAPVGPPAGSPPEAGPRTVEAGVPVGYARSAAGAAAAATSYLTVASEGLLLMDTAGRDAAVRRMLVPNASPGTLASVMGDPTLLERVRKASTVGGAPRAVLRNVPVAYRVDAFSPARARVSVWAAAVWSIAGVGGPGEAWTTTALELEWVDGDWRLWSLSSKDGPTPATTSGPVAGTDELIAALAGFSSYRYGPG